MQMVTIWLSYSRWPLQVRGQGVDVWSPKKLSMIDISGIYSEENMIIIDTPGTSVSEQI